MKKVIFWGLTLAFCVSNFIRLFINPSFGQGIKDYFQTVPLPIKLLILVIFVLILFWSFPYRKRSTE